MVSKISCQAANCLSLGNTGKTPTDSTLLEITAKALYPKQESFLSRAFDRLGNVASRGHLAGQVILDFFATAHLSLEGAFDPGQFSIPTGNDLGHQQKRNGESNCKGPCRNIATQGDQQYRANYRDREGNYPSNSTLAKIGSKRSQGTFCLRLTRQ
jgi:hypothetical protein